MVKKILVNAQNSEEMRIAVVNNGELIDFDSETLTKKPIKGNIYLAKVVRVEPSLQAVFIEYGHEKNGFLPFTEIHPDYYKIPVDDLKNNEKQIESSHSSEQIPLSENQEVIDQFAYPEGMLSTEEKDNSNEDEKKNKKKQKKHRYSVQEVIYPKQVLLVQAIKDERGNKCATFTTYLSLAGQYSVLIPNAGERAGGISKRIHQDDTRKRLKDVIKNLEIPDKMSIIIRTAGQERTKAEIRRDYEYLTRIWTDIRTKTLESNAPLLIHEEADILMRVVRDFYKKDVEEILVDTQEAYKQIRIFMKKLSPSGVKKIKLYKDTNISLLNAFNVENQIIAMVNPRVALPSGGSIVIGQTEALVAIDVNSGKATKERHIDTTALKTNLEAAKEIAKQLKLRDLSGLIVIDFIDMGDNKHIQQVEKYFKQELESDRARIQVANISQFGLMEMSRQRLRSSIMEAYSEICMHCQGRGMMYSRRYFVSTVLHLLEKSISTQETTHVHVFTPPLISDLLFNKNRKEIFEMEQKYKCNITIHADKNLADADFVIDNGRGVPSLFSLEKLTGESIEDGQEIENINKKIQNKKNQLKNKEINMNEAKTENTNPVRKSLEKIWPQENANKQENEEQGPAQRPYRKKNRPPHNRKHGNINKDDRNAINQNEGFEKKTTEEVKKERPLQIETKKLPEKKKTWLKRIFNPRSEQ